MICPQCKCELHIKEARIEVVGDESPDTTTKVSEVQDMICDNPNCINCGRVLDTTKHLLMEK